jgi:hypothetical protein
MWLLYLLYFIAFMVPFGWLIDILILIGLFYFMKYFIKLMIEFIKIVIDKVKGL